MSVPCVWTCRILLLACLLWGAGEAVEMENGRVVLNLGFLTSKTGGFISAGALYSGEVCLCVPNVPSANVNVVAVLCVLWNLSKTAITGNPILVYLVAPFADRCPTSVLICAGQYRVDRYQRCGMCGVSILLAWAEGIGVLGRWLPHT